MTIKVLHMLEGADQAEGLTVIIDVFRAFTLEAYLFAWGAEEVIPVGDLETAYRLKEENPDYVLIGERHGKILPGFDFGNSPSTVDPEKIKGHIVVHTTSAGTQGIAHASGADEILTGSLVNAKAIADWIIRKKPEHVSLVCMGWEGLRNTEEDELCAEYIKSMIEGHPLENIAQQAHDLRYTEGRKFFDPLQNDVFPQDDFGMCIDYDKFDFIIRVEQRDGLFHAEKVNVHEA